MLNYIEHLDWEWAEQTVDYKKQLFCLQKFDVDLLCDKD